MIDPSVWMPDILSRLHQTFGPRLLYLGLQGSYRRGEAQETSDIDLVVVLDGVALHDLDAYRALVHAMPEGHKACGFISGAQELFHWPRHELFAFKMDTTDYYGTLEALLPPITEHDGAEGVSIGASALVHALTHSYLYAAAPDRPAILKEVCKAAFFVMVVAHFLDTGVYCRSKTELLSRLDGAEKHIITAGCNMPQWLTTHTEHETYGLLLHWCRNMLTLRETHDMRAQPHIERIRQ